MTAPLAITTRDLSRLDLLTRIALEYDPREVRMRTLADSMQALDLRLARVLAWLREQPLEQLGFPGWEAFCRERVDWCES